MVKSSVWAKSLPPLGVLLAVTLAAAGIALWVDGSGSPGSDSLVGRAMTMAQAARAEARAAMTGDSARIAELERMRSRIDAELTAARASGNSAPVSRLLSAPEWTAVARALATIGEAGDELITFHAERARLLEQAPELLSTTANFAGTLPPADLRANQIHLERFELAVETLQQNARTLATPAGSADSVQRLGDTVELLGQILGGLRGTDASLGIPAVTQATAVRDLEAAGELFEEIRGTSGALAAAADGVARAEAALADLDTAAAALLQAYGGLEVAPAALPTVPGWVDRLPFLLVGVAVLLMALILLAYHRARDFRRAAEREAEQNERNQQAILRLLDELSSLADGDLTIQATVTEDITGAIADSINYAIEALRKLVMTVNESSILVDSAAKQTEATALHLVRAAEQQTKQAAAASDSVAKMAASGEEISGNAERCADVARHAVDVAHKGGVAVRRTIEGMNTIRETIQDTSKRIKRLGESSQEIGNIVELIEEIAEQTNILALNASIEASRAGESSRGFAVVADEVQKLAERSTNATKKIEVLVSTIQSDTNEAVVSMERSTTDVVGGALLAENAGAALDEIEQVSHQIASLVQNISSSARDQNVVSSAINKNMQVLRQISGKTTESTAATSSAISKLSELASQLRRTVRGFRLPDQAGATGVLNQVKIAEDLKRQAQEEPAPGKGGATPQTAGRMRQSG
jgi:twitching motility protein PilJ